MRFLQSLLLLVGGICLGTVAGFFAVALCVAALQPDRQEEPWTRGFGQYIGGLVCGAPLGAIAGLILGIVRVRAQQAVWHPAVWLGIVAGLALGPLLSFRFGVSEGFGWWGIAAVSAICGIAGGGLAGLALAIKKSATKRR